TCFKGSDCCTGICKNVNGALGGTCGALTVSSLSCEGAGTVTGNAVAGGGTVCPFKQGITTCGSNCCSSAFGATGAATGYSICEQPSGCHPIGEICLKDSDCCGNNGLPQPQPPSTKNRSCQFGADPTVGRCGPDGNGCTQPGIQCKLNTNSCANRNS